MLGRVGVGKLSMRASGVGMELEDTILVGRAWCTPEYCNRVVSVEGSNYV
jgi:hypothetical protein